MVQSPFFRQFSGWIAWIGEKLTTILRELGKATTGRITLKMTESELSKKSNTTMSGERGSQQRMLRGIIARFASRSESLHRQYFFQHILTIVCKSQSYTSSKWF
jgi:hypothetical protein